jgi:hypothetical protein
VGLSLDIPVIVGAENATKILKSGTVVAIDSSRGICGRVTKFKLHIVYKESGQPDVGCPLSILQTNITGPPNISPSSRKHKVTNFMITRLREG